MIESRVGLRGPLHAFLKQTMSKLIGRAEVRRMLAEEGAQIVDVLPAEEFESEHIAGALSIPLKTLNEESVKQLDRGRPVILYCDDFQ